MGRRRRGQGEILVLDLGIGGFYFGEEECGEGEGRERGEK